MKFKLSRTAGGYYVCCIQEAATRAVPCELMIQLKTLWHVLFKTPPIQYGMNSLSCKFFDWLIDLLIDCIKISYL